MTLQDLVSHSAHVHPSDMPARYEGALLGLAVGNMLGVPVEFRTKSTLKREYPTGLREIDPRLATEPWDDDLAQAVVLAEAASDGGDFDVGDLAKRLVVWQRENGRGIGRLTSQVIDLLEAGVSAADAARQAWERTGATNAGNGAVMRCAPVALRWRRDGEALVRNALTSAIVTHYDPRCRWSTAVTATAIALALSVSSVELEDVAGAAAASGAPDACVAAIRAVSRADIHEMLLDGDDQGFTLKAMQIGLRCLYAPGGFEDTLVQVVMQGGDTDTNGAVAGAVMGARLGVEAIPSRWVECVPHAVYVSNLAGRLITLAEP